MVVIVHITLTIIKPVFMLSGWIGMMYRQLSHESMTAGVIPKNYSPVEEGRCALGLPQGLRREALAAVILVNGSYSVKNQSCLPVNDHI